MTLVLHAAATWFMTQRYESKSETMAAADNPDRAAPSTFAPAKTSPANTIGGDCCSTIDPMLRTVIGSE